MSIRLLQGDCREVLRTLPDASVQCVVTSPPYYGLRDYGTAQWEGGDAACDHSTPRSRGDDIRPGDKQGTSAGSRPNTQRECSCGARRIDQQLGLEATPDAYIATMVEVFREVKRVLRSDGVCFVNIGDGYCSATQGVRYVLREDLTVAELQRVALAVFGVRITGEETASQGALPEVLPVSHQGEAVCGQSEMAGRGIEKGIRSASLGSDSADFRTQPADEGQGSGDAGREVCLLRRDDPAVSDVGSYPRGWSGTSEASDREIQSLVDKDISGSLAQRVPEGSLPGALLQLQLRNRLMGLLSARQFAGDEIPAAVRSCFKASATLKPKDLLMMPARLALALQADGWWIRSDIIWAKPNPMPESVTDRPTSAHEHIFLLTKASRYFYDADAVREEAINEGRVVSYDGTQKNTGHENRTYPGAKPRDIVVSGRNLRNVWTIATHAFSAAHFATYPPELVERCIRAGTSERGCCAACGKPWVRVVERSVVWHQRTGTNGNADRNDGGMSCNADRSTTTTGWRASCQCNAEVVPCVVLDCFAGAGTTLLVADRLQRDAIGIDLNADYTRMAMERIRADAPLLTEIAEPEDAYDRPIRDLFQQDLFPVET